MTALILAVAVDELGTAAIRRTLSYHPRAAQAVPLSPADYVATIGYFNLPSTAVSPPQV